MIDLKKIITLGILLAAFGIGGVTLTGCNTVEGLGQDTRALGRAITGAAEDNKNY